MIGETWLQPMRRGFGELCVLIVLSRGESYGYELLARIRQLETLSFSESTLYPMLSKMAGAGLLKTREAPSERGKKRRYYALTRQGEARLEDLLEQWNQLQDAIGTLIEMEGGQNGEV
ncbi:MAG: PadR family transcriptional regulator [Pseudomonadota bacterium]